MSEISLLDLADGCWLAEWYVVFHCREPHFFWHKWLKQGFRHVELWRSYKFGKSLADVVWLRVTPAFEVLHADIVLDPTPPWVAIPGSTTQKVRTILKPWKVRQWFHFGPFSCTELVKFGIGINKFWVRTPYQLYKYIKRHNGVLKQT